MCKTEASLTVSGTAADAVVAVKTFFETSPMWRRFDLFEEGNDPADMVGWSATLASLHSINGCEPRWFGGNGPVGSGF